MTIACREPSSRPVYLIVLGKSCAGFSNVALVASMAVRVKSVAGAPPGIALIHETAVAFDDAQKPLMSPSGRCCGRHHSRRSSNRPRSDVDVQKTSCLRRWCRTRYRGSRATVTTSPWLSEWAVPPARRCSTRLPSSCRPSCWCGGAGWLAAKSRRRAVCLNPQPAVRDVMSTGTGWPPPGGMVLTILMTMALSSRVAVHVAPEPEG